MAKPDIRDEADLAHRLSTALRAERCDHLGRALRQAFPVPGSGAFSDLVPALDAADEKRR